MLNAVVTEPHDAGHSQEADGQTQEDPSLHANLLVPLRDTSQVQGVGWEGGAFIDFGPFLASDTTHVFQCGRNPHGKADQTYGS